jgi:catechol 2,3-dioxygenase-like lactoylglutathione lyase family enzyme
MSTAKALDVSHVIYQVTDLDQMQSFLQDFGLVKAHRDGNALYMRGAGADVPYAHVSLLGKENKFIGGGLRVGSKAELEALSRAVPGASAVEEVEDAPGGGWRVRMATPDGVRIDAVFGGQAEPLPLREPHPFNAASRKQRINASLRPKREAGLVLRLGHFVLRTPDHLGTVQWFKTHFGLRPSDYMAPADALDQPYGIFLRMDRGDRPVDHHSLLVTRNADVGVHHSSFEMQDLDVLMGSHEWLESKGWRLECGVGRHLLGSQIYDYWRDPFGFRLEHYTDGDMVNDQYVSQTFSGGGADETTQWGMKPPKEFFA